MRIRARWLPLLLLAVYAVASIGFGVVAALRPSRSQDLAHVYMASRLWRRHLDPYAAYSKPQWQELTAARVVPEVDVAPSYSTPYPPIALLNLAPISGGEWDTAQRLWLALNLVLVVYVPWVIRHLWFRDWNRLQTTALFVVWLGGMGLRSGLANGQHALFWWAMLLSAVWLMKRHRSGWSGVPLALSLHKYPLTLPLLPYLVLRRATRPLLVMTAVSAALVGVFFLWIHAAPGSVFESYRREVEFWLGRTEMGELPGFGKTHFLPVVRALVGSGTGGAVVMYTLLGTAAVLVYWPKDTSAAVPSAVDVACLVMFTLWSGYHAVYDTIPLILPIAVIAQRTWQREPGAARFGAIGLLAALLVAWYADAGNTVRLLTAVRLEPPAGSGAALDLVYRAIIASGFATCLFFRHAHPRYQRISR